VLGEVLLDGVAVWVWVDAVQLGAVGREGMNTPLP